MMTISIPDTLYHRIQTLAIRHNTDIEHFVEEAIYHEEQRRETEMFFHSRKQYFDLNAFHDALQHIPNAEPEEHDKL